MEKSYKILKAVGLYLPGDTVTIGESQGQVLCRRGYAEAIAATTEEPVTNARVTAIEEEVADHEERIEALEPTTTTAAPETTTTAAP